MARPKIEFWLNEDKPEELELLQSIYKLKDQRRFSKTIRDGIRLILDLRNGQLDVLFELFPWVAAEWKSHMEIPNVVEGDKAVQKITQREVVVREVTVDNQAVLEAIWNLGEISKTDLIMQKLHQLELSINSPKMQQKVIEAPMMSMEKLDLKLEASERATNVDTSKNMLNAIDGFF